AANVSGRSAHGRCRMVWTGTPTRGSGDYRPHRGARRGPHRGGGGDGSDQRVSPQGRRGRPDVAGPGRGGDPAASVRSRVLAPAGTDRLGSWFVVVGAHRSPDPPQPRRPAGGRPRPRPEQTIMNGCDHGLLVPMAAAPPAVSARSSALVSPASFGKRAWRWAARLRYRIARRLLDAVATRCGGTGAADRSGSPTAREASRREDITR